MTLRSVNSVTGALIGVAAAATYVLAAVATEMAVGRPAGEQGFLLDVGEPLRYVIKK